MEIWDTATWRRTTTLTSHTRGVAALAIAPDGAWLPTGGSRDGSVRIWRSGPGS
nr:WD40 repeat domain-containing protein [Streptomyces odonnellii]